MLKILRSMRKKGLKPVNDALAEKLDRLFRDHFSRIPEPDLIRIISKGYGMDLPLDGKLALLNTEVLFGGEAEFEADFCIGYTHHSLQYARNFLIEVERDGDTRLMIRLINYTINGSQKHDGIACERKTAVSLPQSAIIYTYSHGEIPTRHLVMLR
ncbi:MAG: hypothetical protein LBU32_14385 [Clostridiales bacterium]|jgi:hypothetical protein|nr:hypothetical protein [Clostridiales bacterium]